MSIVIAFDKTEVNGKPDSAKFRSPRRN